MPLIAEGTGLVDSLGQQFWTIMSRGGPVMWPIFLLSVIAVALSIERGWFWWRLHRTSEIQRLRRVGDALRAGNAERVATLLARDTSPYAAVALRLIEDGASDGVAIEAVEQERPRLDRFMNILSTVITAAPMLGILGTVTGIIKSFQLLGGDQTLVDPRQVSAGIAEALITTAAGLVVALVTLFPFMAFRAQVERALGRIESLVAAAQHGFAPAARRTDTAPSQLSPNAPAKAIS
ncbi:MAG: MotA/TolQ/ExbB proton channel family protein [Phycisphaerae bacterium]|nr:MotA/TolQ/ExbB proton channel family protein [Phycisphaerae bacterium]